MKRELWATLFDENSIPRLPCPRCDDGRLKLKGNTLNREEPKYSIAAAKHEDWDPDWTVERFTALLECDNSKCGELVSVLGDTELVQGYGEEDDGGPGWTFTSVLRPRGMFPAPPLFPVSKEISRPVGIQLRLAFQLFWLDLSSCVARLRTSLELVLDDMKIPRAAVGKKGSMKRLDLAGRITLFEKNAGDADNAESMHALRVIGNLGTHDADVSAEALFDALDVYEDALLEIYEKKSMKLKAKKKKLIAEKGKY